MKVSTDLLARFRANRAARQEFVAAGLDIAQLAADKKAIWGDVHTKYNIPASTKLKIELDGDLAGELRLKAGGVYVAPVLTTPTCDVVAGTRFAVSVDGNKSVHNTVDELISFFEETFDVTVIKVAA